MVNYPPTLLAAADVDLLSGLLRSGETCTVRVKPGAEKESQASRTSGKERAAYGVGDGVVCIPDGKEGTVAAVHYDDLDPYYTIKFANGAERQTIESKLQRGEKSTSAAGSACPACTFINGAAAAACEVCGTPLATANHIYERQSSAMNGASGVVAERVQMPDDNSCLFHAIIRLVQVSN